MNTEFQSFTVQSTNELKEVLNSNALLNSKLQAMEKEFRKAQENNQTMSKLLDGSRVDSAKMEFQRDEVMVRVRELKSTIDFYFGTENHLVTVSKTIQIGQVIYPNNINSDYNDLALLNIQGHFLALRLFQ